MKQFAILFISILSFFGCQNVDQPEKPKNLIPKNKMVDILTETYLSNAARSVDNKSIIAKGVKMDSLIYQNFGVDSVQFARSNAFYAADINAYMGIFQDVETRLGVMRIKMDSLVEKERDVKDSINNLQRSKIDISSAKKDSLL
ncbi:DUF4296 domain-containing protein [Aequorivita capsosiphonis]|uniref:DUF4296 domain-containing protein n=1 Tax=Aequorivita capsosiphonis TaxID=487317 RepID=UPI0004295BB3|nr:DUF4296 domain-containing protein [Aequorivita capsosiphonis]